MVHPDSSNLVLTGGEGPSPDYPMVVSYSTNSGGSWTRHLLSDTVRGYVYALAIAPSQPNVIYAGGCINAPGAVFVSTDFGRTWDACASAPTGKVYGLAIHPDDPDVVYAAAQDSTWKTTDGGATWNRIGGGYYLSDVKLFPGCPDTVLVSGRYGVAMSEDGGGTWTSLNAGLTSLDVICLDFSVTDRIDLFAGTKGGAVCRYSFLTGIEESANDEWRMMNDRSMTATIVRGVLFLPEASSVKRGASCVLLDITGRQVMELRPGPNDARHLSPGVYFLCLASSVERGASSVRKVIIQR